MIYSKTDNQGVTFCVGFSQGVYCIYVGNIEVNFFPTLEQSIEWIENECLHVPKNPLI